MLRNPYQSTPLDFSDIPGDMQDLSVPFEFRAVDAIFTTVASAFVQGAQTRKWAWCTRVCLCATVPL